MKTLEFVKAKQKVWADINNLELIGSKLIKEKNATPKNA